MVGGKGGKLHQVAIYSRGDEFFSGGRGDGSSFYDVDCGYSSFVDGKRVDIYSVAVQLGLFRMQIKFHFVSRNNWLIGATKMGPIIIIISSNTFLPF